MHREGVTLENHREMVTIFSPALQREFLRQLDAWYPQGARIVEIDGYDIPVPPLEFDVLFIFLHMYKHFVLEGVGLRQLCDWAIVLDRANLKDIQIKGCTKG